MTEDAKHFEVIFMSCDQKQTAFDLYFSEMPWLALPFKDPRIQLIAQEIGVKGVPHLLAVNLEGKILNINAVLLVIEDGPEYIDLLVQ